jgi:hypothetical protein
MYKVAVDFGFLANKVDVLTSFSDERCFFTGL